MTAHRVVILTGCGLFVAIMVSLHVIRQDLSPLGRGISRYAGSDTLGVATVGFLALAAALIALARVFRLAHPAAGRGLITAACGIIAVAATPIGNPDRPTSVTLLHTIGGIAFYLGVLQAMRSSASDWTDRQLARGTTVALGLFVLGAVSLPGLGQVVGILQRLVFVLAVGWMTQAAVRFRVDTSQHFDLS